MNWDTIRFLKATYKEHYFRDSDRIEFPSKIEEREFGYMPFGGGMVRHLTFRSDGLPGAPERQIAHHPSPERHGAGVPLLYLAGGLYSVRVAEVVLLVVGLEEPDGIPIHLGQPSSLCKREGVFVLPCCS